MSEIKKIATRDSYGNALVELGKEHEDIVVLDADLAGSTKTGVFKKVFPDRHFNCGIAEANMASIAAGMAKAGLVPFVSTFSIFAALRSADQIHTDICYQNVNAKIIATHSGTSFGQAGSTHHAICDMAVIRSMPNINVYRPADGRETTAAWISAVTGKNPSCLILSRQTLPMIEGTGDKAFKGGYILADSDKKVPDAILIATGSEVNLAVSAKAELANKGIDARVVSMPCVELFEEQSKAYKDKVLLPSVRARVAVEAGADFGWGKYVGLDGKCIAMESFGASAPAEQLFDKFGFKGL